MHHGYAEPRDVLDEFSDAKAGEPRRLSKGEALLAIQRRSDCTSNTRFAEQRVVAEMYQYRLGLVASKHHDRLLSGSSKSRRRIVL